MWRTSFSTCRSSCEVRGAIVPLLAALPAVHRAGHGAVDRHPSHPIFLVNGAHQQLGTAVSSLSVTRSPENEELSGRIGEPPYGPPRLAPGIGRFSAPDGLDGRDTPTRIVGSRCRSKQECATVFSAWEESTGKSRIIWHRHDSLARVDLGHGIEAFGHCRQPAVIRRPAASRFTSTSS